MGHPSARGLLVSALVAALALTPAAAPATAAPTDPGPREVAPRDPAVNLRGDVRRRQPDARTRTGYRRWPGHTIRFHSSLDPSFDWSIDAAVGAWNQSGLRMTFKRVRSQRRAQLLIKPTGGLGIFGEATLGYNPWGGLRNNWVKISRNALTDKGDTAYLAPWLRRVVTAHIIAHELGHTLGIDHQRQTENACGLMMPTLLIGTCDVTGAEMGHYKCGMTDAWVLRRAVRTYGGRRTPGTTYCPILPIPAAPAGLVVSGGIADDRPVQVDWTPPGSVAPGTAMHIRVSSGEWCPARVGRDDYGWPQWADDTFDEYVVDPALGTWHEPIDTWDDSHEVRCITAHLVNEAGGSATPASLLRIPWYPQPAAPTVTGVVQLDWQSYEVSLSPAEIDDWSLEHFVLVYPEGQCGTEPIAYAGLRTGAGSLYFRSDLERPCIRVVALRGQRVSTPTTWQVG